MQKERNSNFELLRIIAMLCIILGHMFQDSILKNYVFEAENFEFFYDYINNSNQVVHLKTILMDFCYAHFGNGCNIIFMLITGYYLYDKDYDFYKQIKKAKSIIFTVVFYGFVLLFFTFAYYKFIYINVDKTIKPIFRLTQWIGSSGWLWYIQVYCIFILFVVPILKIFEKKINREKHYFIMWALIILTFCQWEERIPNLIISSNVMTFILCYYLGGYIAKYKIDVSWKKLISLSSLYIIVFCSYDYYWRRINKSIYGAESYTYRNMISVFLCHLIFGVLMFLIFKKINIHSKVINTISKSTMGQYIFHLNVLSYGIIIANKYIWNDWSLDGYFIFILIYSIALYIICLIIDLFRQYIFKKLKL